MANRALLHSISAFLGLAATIALILGAYVTSVAELYGAAAQTFAAFIVVALGIETYVAGERTGALTRRQNEIMAELTRSQTTIAQRQLDLDEKEHQRQRPKIVVLKNHWRGPEDLEVELINNGGSTTAIPRAFLYLDGPGGLREVESNSVTQRDASMKDTYNPTVPAGTWAIFNFRFDLARSRTPDLTSAHAMIRPALADDVAIKCTLPPLRR